MVDYLAGSNGSESDMQGTNVQKIRRSTRIWVKKRAKPRVRGQENTCRNLLGIIQEGKYMRTTPFLRMDNSFAIKIAVAKLLCEKMKKHNN